MLDGVGQGNVEGNSSCTSLSGEYRSGASLQEASASFFPRIPVLGLYFQKKGLLWTLALLFFFVVGDWELLARVLWGTWQKTLCWLRGQSIQVRLLVETKPRSHARPSLAEPMNAVWASSAAGGT